MRWKSFSAQQYERGGKKIQRYQKNAVKEIDRLAQRWSYQNSTKHDFFTLSETANQLVFCQRQSRQQLQTFLLSFQSQFLTQMFCLFKVYVAVSKIPQQVSFEATSIFLKVSICNCSCENFIDASG